MRSLNPQETTEYMNALQKVKAAERALIDALTNKPDLRHGLTADEIHKLEKGLLIPVGMLSPQKAQL